MKISFLMSHLQQFGGIRRIVEISNCLVRSGNQVTIYHPEGTPCDWLPCLAPTRRIDELLDARHSILVYVGDHHDQYRRAAAGLRYHYVLGIYLLKRQPLAEAVRLWLRGVRGYEYYRTTPINLQTALAYRDRKIVVSAWLGKWLMLNHGHSADVVQGGVNQAMFHPVDAPHDNGAVVVLGYGRQKMWKDTGTLVKAFELARRRNRRLVLDTFADKGYAQDQMAGIYSRADIFVNTELFGGWSNPVAEAMACGVPVISTDIGAVADFAVHGQNAILVPRQDPRALARAILSLSADEEARRRLAANGLATIRAFTWERAARQLTAVFERDLAAPANTAGGAHG